MPRRKRPRVASLDEVRISRDKDAAIIEFLDGETMSVHFQLGPAASEMTDREILACFNEWLREQKAAAQAAWRPAVETPEGKPQIEYSEGSDQWVPRGDVLRCLIDDGGPDGEATVTIDDHELNMHEFGHLLAVYAGWGMRIVFVAEDEIGKQPEIEIRDSRDV